MTDEEARPTEPTEPQDDADDTEGHSMQMVDFARTVQRDRVREAEQMARESRMREANNGPKRGRSLFRR